MQLYHHQAQVLNETKDFKNCAYYLDMGLGKTYVGSEAMMRYGCRVNLLICQKSKILDWCDHFDTNYHVVVYNLTNKKDFEDFIFYSNRKEGTLMIGVINYELVYRRVDLMKLKNFTLMCDESSQISNEKAKRSKFILKMKPEHVILLSGTPVSGKYERLWSQCRLLGWKVNKSKFWNMFIDYILVDFNHSGRSVPMITGYKNVEVLKNNLREHGAVFMKLADTDLNDIPDMNDVTIHVPITKEYKRFLKKWYVDVNGEELIGDTTLTRRLYARQLCGQYNKNKLEAVRDILAEAHDRVIIFYNYKAECEKLLEIAEGLSKYVSVINGQDKNLDAYEEFEDSVTLIQYQAGAMGLNLQLSNKIIYFTLPDKSELFEQSKARIHRIGQTRPCYYYYLMCDGSIEYDILETLKMRRDYTDRLFQEGFEK